jgi:RNA polymerase primary sigma factor
MVWAMTCRSDDADLYDREPKRTPLSREREQELFAQLRATTDMGVRERLAAHIILHNLSFAHQIATETPTVLPMRAARRAAVRGMYEALLRFEPERGWKFISYAVHWMRQSIRVEEKTLRPVAMPTAGPGRYARIRRRMESGMSEAQAVEAENISMDEWHHLANALANMESIDREVDAEDRPPAECISCEQVVGQQPAPDDTWQSLIPPGLLAQAIESCPPMERAILRSYYGLQCDASTLDAIGQRHWVSRERIRQIRDRALRRVRVYLTTYGPQELLEKLEEENGRPQRNGKARRGNTGTGECVRDHDRDQDGRGSRHREAVRHGAGHPQG